MTDASDAIVPARVMFGFGVLLLALTALQVWRGKALRWRPREIGEMLLRRKQPKEFWYTMFLSAALALWLIFLGVKMSIRWHVSPF
jgi:hypothetical protein